MLFHQFREHFIFGLQLGFKLLDAFQFGFVLAVLLVFESGSTVFKKLLLPAVENIWLQVVLIAQVRDGYPVNQMSFENENLFLWGVIFSLFSHGEFLRFCTLTQTAEFSNSR